MSKMSDSEYQFNSNKHNRRSSILKPAKVVDNRAPLQELGASSDDTTTTTASIYKKRVSFHVINIKEYSTHAQTQEVQKGPAYNEFLSSMSDSSRNNTNNECSSFSPMVPAYVIPQDEDKENQINYGDDTDSFADEDSSELCEENHNEPFDLSTKSKNESKNFLESTKLSHCNTIMTTFNISGIQNLDETNMQDLDESDDSSFQRMIDQQPPAVNLFNYQESRKSLSRKSLSANRETKQEEPVLNLFQSQQDSRKSVSRKSISAMSAQQDEQENAFQYQQEVRKSMSRKSMSTYHEPEPDNSSDSVELTCHVPVNIVPAALDESSSMEMTTALPKRKSIAPRKSVNFKCTQDESQSDEMEFTSAFPPMTQRHTDPNESQFEESAMEVTGVLPRKSFGPTKLSSMDSSSSQDGVPMWRKSVSNKSAYTKAMELTDTSLSESKQSPDISKLEKTHNVSSMDLVSMSQKSSRKSVGGNVSKNIENLDESGMEMTEAFNVIPPNLNSTDYTSNDTEYPSNDVSMSESISDMDISNQSPPNVTNTTQSMLADKTNFANASSVDFTIKTTFADNIGRKLISAKNMLQLNDAPSNNDILRNSNAVHHKSFSGFENSALNPSSMLNRKSAPHAMMFSHESRDIVPCLDKNNHLPDDPSRAYLSLDKRGSTMNISSVTGRKSMPQTNSNFVSQSNMHKLNDESTVPVDAMPFSNSSLHNQSKCTQDFTSFTSLQPIPMAHSTNLNISLEQKNSSLLNVSQKTSVAHENNSVSQTSPQGFKSSANLTSVQQKEPVNSSTHEDSMELSCAFPLNSKSASNEVENSRMETSSVAPQANTSDSKTTTDKAIEQPESEPNKENSIVTNTNISVMQSESMHVTISSENIAETIYSAGDQIEETKASTSIHEKSTGSMHVTIPCENMGETIYSAGDQIEETMASTSIADKSAEGNIQPSHEKTVPDVYNMSVDCSTIYVETNKNDVPNEELSSKTSGNSDENDQLPSIKDIKKNESQKSLRVSTDKNFPSGHRNESLIPSNVSTDDGFSSTRDSHQSNESGVSPLKSAQASIVDSEGERSRKRPSDGFEAHEENLVQCGDSNNVVVANPKKRSKTFELEAFQESREVEPENRANEATSPANETCSVDTDRNENSTAETDNNSPAVETGPIVVVTTPAKTNRVTATPSKSSLVAGTLSKTPVVSETPSKTVQVAATAIKTPVAPGSPNTTPLVSSTPRKTPTVAANPSKTSVASNSCKTPMFVTPIKPPVLATPRKDLTFVTPGKITEANDNSQDSIDSINFSTYANPSSTLTDSIINNITDIMGLPLIGSVRKHSASEVKAKQISSCSTPLLPNSCSKTMIVDRFFQSIDNRGKRSDSFVVPSKNIIKKLDLTRGESKQDLSGENRKDDSCPANATFSSGSSGSCENTPVDENVETNLRLKRTKDQVNISHNDDPNSSNYIPEKHQRNTSMNIMNTSQHSTIESVVNEISLLDISEDLEKIDHVRSALATTLNITDVPDKSMRDHTSFSHTLSVLNETETASNIQAPCKQNIEFNKPEKTTETSEVVKVIETHASTELKAMDVVEEMHTGATEEKSQSIIEETVRNSPKPPTTYPEIQSTIKKMDQTNSNQSSTPTESSKQKNHDSESSDPSQVERANFMKKRKSRLSIVPKQSPVKAAPSQNDTKRKTLKIQPKKCMVFESGDDSVEEIQDYAERNILTEEKRGSHEWKLKTLEPNMWEFEFLNGLIVLKVEFNQQGKKSRKDKAVKNICFVTTDDSTELRALCFKLLHSKYSMLSSMCSSSCDVIPLLQHISPFMSYLRQFARAMKLCELKYGMKLQGTKMLVDIKSYSKLEWSQVTLELKDIDFITPNEIHVKKMFGNLTESEVRKQFPVFATRDNADFIKTFIEKIYNFLDAK